MGSRWMDGLRETKPRRRNEGLFGKREEMGRGRSMAGRGGLGSAVYSIHSPSESSSSSSSKSADEGMAQKSYFVQQFIAGEIVFHPP